MPKYKVFRTGIYEAKDIADLIEQIEIYEPIEEISCTFEKVEDDKNV